MDCVESLCEKYNILNNSALSVVALYLWRNCSDTWRQYMKYAFSSRASLITRVRSWQTRLSPSLLTPPNQYAFINVQASGGIGSREED